MYGVDHIVVFGDSLSDTGRHFEQFKKISMTPFDPVPSAPYIGGRFCNGPVWIDYIAHGSRVKFTNYAIGGARAIDQVGNVSLAQQVSDFVVDVGAVANTLAIIAIGSNDVLDNMRAQSIDFPRSVADIISNNINHLRSAGVRRFLVANLPPLAETPHVRKNHVDLVPYINYAVNEINAELLVLAAKINRVQQILDVNTVMQHLLCSTSWASRGITNITDSCISTVDHDWRIEVDQKQYVWWDDIHPTTVVHRIIAEKAKNLLTSNFNFERLNYGLF